jgi:hypothetical protein
LDYLHKKAKKHDILNSSNIEEIYGPDTIEKQRAIEEELNQNRGLNPESNQLETNKLAASELVQF